MFINLYVNFPEEKKRQATDASYSNERNIANHNCSM